MKNILLITGVLFVLNVNSQTFNFCKYREYYNKGQYEFVVNGDYKEALRNYNELFIYGNSTIPNSNDLIAISICYLNLKDTAKAIEILRQSVLKGNINIEDQTWVVKMFSKKDWQLLKDELPKLKNDYWCNMPDKENYNEIVKLEANDQLVRLNFTKRISDKDYGRIIEITDSLNFYKLKQLVTSKNASPLCFLMYHIYGENVKYYNFYDSIFKAKIFMGEADPSAYAQWLDRQRMYVNHLSTQLYGEWNEIGSDEFNPIEDIVNVDKRRFEIGLCSLEDYSKFLNMKLPAGYLPPNKKK